jgi:drug/metabolite transporter (DMT)-like permease
MRNTLKIAWPGVPFALGAALLFGVSTPLAKSILGTGVDPWLLAGLLYLFSGIGLLAVVMVRRIAAPTSREAPLRLADLPWLGLTVAVGGVAAPVLLMTGLSITPASTAALLLNLETVATVAIAALVFRENIDTRIALGAISIAAGAAVLSWQDGLAVDVGALAVAGAALAWALDNNLTRKISHGDPIQIAMVKGLCAGTINLGIAAANAADVPPVAQIGGAALIGLFGYGFSLALFVLALRHLGAARTGAYFATAPFIGVVVAVLVLDEPVTVRLGIAAVLMGIGLWLHITELHEHEHRHSEQDHEHLHHHDLHHQREHASGDPAGAPHAHRHRHEPIVHGHPHYPDLHHRHTHSHES